MQLQLYMHATNIHKGVVLYIEKATLQSKTFTITYDEKTAAGVMARFAELHQRLKSGEIPIPEARLTQGKSWMCVRCEHREKCWGDTPEEQLKKLRMSNTGAGSNTLNASAQV